MTNRTGSARRPAAATTAKRRVLPLSLDRTVVSESRIERMVRLVDHCTAAQGLADDLDETFLSYLLAMAIQETRTAMRRSTFNAKDSAEPAR